LIKSKATLHLKEPALNSWKKRQNTAGSPQNKEYSVEFLLKYKVFENKALILALKKNKTPSSIVPSLP
jgi:hypothetical protein